MTTKILFLDLSPNWCGWCIGQGRTRPLADAFLLPQTGDDLAALGEAFEERVKFLVAMHKPVAIGYESPIKLPHDSLMTLRRTYGLGFYLEQIARHMGLERREVDCRKVKAALTGDSYADKKIMVAAAEYFQIALPKKWNEGKDDAADAVGGAFEMMAEFDPDAHAYWQSRISQRNGALL